MGVASKHPKGVPPGRVFVLGAGFSQPAGLPLGNGLFALVRKEIRAHHGECCLDRDIERYLRFKISTTGSHLDESTIDLEQFVSYLDIEHSLRLRGTKEILCKEGNATQLLLRKYLAKVIFQRQSQMVESSRLLYNDFARQLEPRDVVITFNYDTIVETSLDSLGKKYRLFPYRIKEQPTSFDLSELDSQDVLIIKLHGSIDWFDKSPYIERKAHLKECGFDSEPTGTIFTPKNECQLQSLVDDGRDESQPLGSIYRCHDMRTYFGCWLMALDAPLLLSPSQNKLLYVDPLRSLWDGVGTNGWLNSSLSVIGYSIPQHDEYALQLLYHIFGVYFGERYAVGNRSKRPAIIVLKPSTDDERSTLLNRYGFCGEDNVVFDWEGLRPELLSSLFDVEPEGSYS